MGAHPYAFVVTTPSTSFASSGGTKANDSANNGAIPGNTEASLGGEAGSVTQENAPSSANKSSQRAHPHRCRDDHWHAGGDGMNGGSTDEVTDDEENIHQMAGARRNGKWKGVPEYKARRLSRNQLGRFLSPFPSIIPLIFSSGFAVHQLMPFPRQLLLPLSSCHQAQLQMATTSQSLPSVTSR
jgi:hypothetical protein